MIVAIALICSYRFIQFHVNPPQALLVLGGEPQRERFAAAFAQQHPSLPIWVSSGSNREYAEWVFAQAGIDLHRVHLDYRAVDTVTNFTTILRHLQRKRIRSVYLITSDDHMQRARTVGEIILGSRGIVIHPVAFRSGRLPEPVKKSIRDGVRAVLWILTGRTGSKFNHYFPEH
jgi:uncharacterized SAM-binding protein YcdF (DUF218 family)